MHSEPRPGNFLDLGCSRRVSPFRARKIVFLVQKLIGSLLQIKTRPTLTSLRYLHGEFVSPDDGLHVAPTQANKLLAILRVFMLSGKRWSSSTSCILQVIILVPGSLL